MWHIQSSKMFVKSAIIVLCSFEVCFGNDFYPSLFSHVGVKRSAMNTQNLQYILPQQIPSPLQPKSYYDPHSGLPILYREVPNVMNTQNLQYTFPQQMPPQLQPKSNYEPSPSLFGRDEAVHNAMNTLNSHPQQQMPSQLQPKSDFYTRPLPSIPSIHPIHPIHPINFPHPASHFPPTNFIPEDVEIFKIPEKSDQFLNKHHPSWRKNLLIMDRLKRGLNNEIRGDLVDSWKNKLYLKDSGFDSINEVKNPDLASINKKEDREMPTASPAQNKSDTEISITTTPATMKSQNRATQHLLPPAKQVVESDFEVFDINGPTNQDQYHYFHTDISTTDWKKYWDEMNSLGFKPKAAEIPYEVPALWYSVY